MAVFDERVGEAPIKTPQNSTEEGADFFCASGWSDLHAIQRPGVRVGWWPRNLSSTVSDCSRQFAQGNREPIVAALRSPQRKNDFLRKFFRVESDARFRPLLVDIEACIDNFWQIAVARWVRVTLETPTDDNCKLFHTDNVELRLLCSYLGPGTQWLPEDRVRREGLGRGDNSSIIQGDGPPKELPTGAVGLFKGERYRQVRGPGAVHRSPPIEGTSLRRLLLRLDAEGCR